MHAAGIGGYLGHPIWEETWESWRAAMALNLDAAFELTRLVVPDMTAAGWGRIVMVGSTAGQVGAPAMSAYSASKAGVLGLIRSVAQDVGSFGVTANAVVPEKSYTVDTGTVVLGAEVTHHFEKLARYVDLPFTGER